MNPFDKATAELEGRIATPEDDQDLPDSVAGRVTPQQRAAQTTVAGEKVTVAEPTTSQADDDTWLSGRSRYGMPRGKEALEARRISQTSAMQSIINGVVDQLLGGELTFESESDDVDEGEQSVRDLMRDIIQGPHLMDDDLDDLVAAAVDDMMGPGNAYWQMLPSENGSVPVVSLVPLDALTIRHNYNKHGYPQDPPYYQAPNAFAEGAMTSMGSVEAKELTKEDLIVMRYPKGRKSHDIYPKSPSIQVREWLEILVNSTTHHNRFYDDNQVPPGLLQVMNARGNDLEDIRGKIENAKGDPRSAPVIGGEGQAMWVEMGGSSVNLSVVDEQQWFLDLCLAAVGLGKHELGFTEDANRSNGEVEATRVYKRVTGPFKKQFENAFRHIAEQFEVYNNLENKFEPKLRFTDPREERAREERLRKMYNDGGLTLRQYVRRRGDADLADSDMTVELNGEVIEYGDYPKPVVDALLRNAQTDSDANSDVGGDDDGSETDEPGSLT